jgi:hypothetical protein
MSGLWVKTLDLLVSTTAACYVGSVVAELRFISVSFRCHWWQVR